MDIRLAATAAAALATAAACSSGAVHQHSAAPPPRSTAPVPASTAPHTTVPTRPPAPAASSTPSRLGFQGSPLERRCHTSQLAMTDDGGQGAGGSFYGRVVFRNISAAPCTLLGFPGLQRLDSGHGPLPTKTVRSYGPPKLVTLSRQQKAYFAYNYIESPLGNQSCSDYTPASYVQVTPPDETDSITIRSLMRPCRPGGETDVSALRADDGKPRTS